MLELAPGAVLDRYEIVRRLGAGGFAVVWLARHRDLSTLHAVKLLKEPRPTLNERLRTEGRLQAELRHPNVVQVTDTLAIDGQLGLVMEYVDGPTLAGLIAVRPALTIPEVDALGRGILRGLAAAHARGWVHRDIKPGNVLVHRELDELCPKVSDFGLVKLLGQDEGDGTTTRLGVGTRGYASLEQLVGAPADPSMDVFSVGCVLYELLEGRAAFGAAGAWEEAVRTDRYPSPERADAPSRMREAVSRALAPRSERAASARELLALWEAGTPVPQGVFSPATLSAVRESSSARLAPLRPEPDAHLPPERLASEALSPEERAHLEACPRCRVDAVRLATFPETQQSTEAPGLSLSDPRIGTVVLSRPALALDCEAVDGLLGEHRGRRVEGEALAASFGSGGDALGFALALRDLDPSVRTALHAGLVATPAGPGAAVISEAARRTLEALLDLAGEGQILGTREGVGSTGRRLVRGSDGSEERVAITRHHLLVRGEVTPLFEVTLEPESLPIPRPRAERPALPEPRLHQRAVALVRQRAAAFVQQRLGPDRRLWLLRAASVGVAAALALGLPGLVLGLPVLQRIGRMVGERSVVMAVPKPVSEPPSALASGSTHAVASDPGPQGRCERTEFELPPALRRLPHRPVKCTQPPPGGSDTHTAIDRSRRKLCAESLLAVQSGMKKSIDHCGLYRSAWMCFNEVHQIPLAESEISTFDDIELLLPLLEGAQIQKERWLAENPGFAEIPEIYRPAPDGLEFRLEQSRDLLLQENIIDLFSEPVLADQLATDLQIEAQLAERLSCLWETEPSPRLERAWARRVFVLARGLREPGSIVNAHRIKVYDELLDTLNRFASTKDPSVPPLVREALAVGRGERDIPRIR